VSSTVLVVDLGSGIREIVESHIDANAWRVVQRDDVDTAWNDSVQRPPDLVVLNADIAKGWNLCAQLKRRFPAVPVVLLSYKANKELFNNHQKLPTRADAYHHLPDELEGLSISLSYYSSHRSETDEDEVPQPKRQRSGGRVSVPTGVVQKLEATVRDQARDIEGLRRQLEALEAERDAVSEKARRQMMELMTVAPGPDLSGEVTSHKRRVAELEAELEAVRAASRDAADRAASMQEAMKTAMQSAESAQTEALALRVQARAQGASAEQLAVTMAQLAQADQRRAAAEAARAAAEERATTAERAWSGVNARAEELHQALILRGQDVERVMKEKTDVEATLATSRRLMKDYISEAARNAESARVASDRARDLEARAHEAAERVAALTGELEFQRALVESLEEAQRHAQEKAAATEASLASTAAALEEARAEGQAHAERVAALEAEVTLLRGEGGEASARVTALSEELTTVRAAAASALSALEAKARLDAEAAAEAHRAALKAAEDQALADLMAIEAKAKADADAIQAAAQAERAELEARLTSELKALTDKAQAEGDGLRASLSDLEERFAALRGWARKLESRLSDSEMTRDAVLARLQSLVDDLRSLPTGVEPPPADLEQGATSALRT